MTSLKSPTIAVACSLEQTASAQELNEIHRASVLRHASILADTENTPSEKIIRYFDDLKSFLVANNYKGCPYTNALIVSRGSDPEITKEVSDHKEFTREFFISISAEITAPSRAKQTGEHFFLLYSGATTESQNLGVSWPIDRSIDLVKQLIENEQAFLNFEHSVL